MRHIYMNFSTNMSDKIDFSNADKGIIKGVASTNSINQKQLKLNPFAFQDSINDRGLDGFAGVHLLYDHNRNNIIGKINKLSYNNNGTQLEIEAKLNLKNPLAVEVFENAKFGIATGFSVGFSTDQVNRDKNGIGIIEKGDLYEVSLTHYPADRNCAVTQVFSDNNKEKEEKENIIGDNSNAEIDPDKSSFFVVPNRISVMEQEVERLSISLEEITALVASLVTEKTQIEQKNNLETGEISKLEEKFSDINEKLNEISLGVK